MKNLLIALSIIFFNSLFSVSMFAQGTGENFKFSSYYEFDLERGYNPGSIVVIKKKSVQSPIYTTDGLTKLLKDKTLFDFSVPVKIPNTVFDRKKNFVIGLEAKSKYEQLPAELKANLDKVRNVSLKVNNGVSYNLKSGAAALTDVIYALPLEALEKLLFEINKKNKIYMISEVIQYNDATLDFSWVTNFDAKLKSDIQKAVDLGVEAKWIDNATLQVKYAAGQLVGYKAIEITGKYIKLIKKKIEYRKINGDDQGMYIDKDKDGYGDANSPCKYIPTSKLALYPNYVGNNRDCYDDNPLANPDQTEFFIGNRGDGSYDYNCDGIINLQYNHNGRCQGGEALQGWDGKIPQPGETGQWLADCDRKAGKGTVMERVARTQGGR